jgi:hypothetical protein
MATKPPARASPELRRAPLSPRYHSELHHPVGHCCLKDKRRAGILGPAQKTKEVT